MGVSWILIYSDVSSKNPGLIVVLTVILAALLLTLFVIGRQPVAEIELSFKVPLVPFIPCLSVLMNIYLMFQLDSNTWIRFAVWLAIGTC